MDRVQLNNFIREAIKAVPAVIAHLSPAYKSYDYFLAQVEGLTRGVYSGNIAGEFIDVMANLISGQLQDAYSKAWYDEGNTGELPDYLSASYQEMVSNQYSFVDAFYRAIVDARIDGTPIEPLLARAQLWAGQYDTAYQNAVALITKEMGGNMIWQEGDTIEKCYQCLSFNGIVARASEWASLGIAPKNFPNDKLDCKGGHCDCTLTPTTKRRSPNAYGRLEEILMTRK